MSDKEKRATCRTMAVKELIATERKYVELLTKLIEYYVVPLRNTNIVTAEDHASLFPHDIHSIHNCNQSFLKALETRTANFDNQNTKIGQEILNFTPYFKMYQNYLNNHERAVGRLKKLQPNSAFNDFIQKTRKNCDNLTLESMLILPIQRIPRYKILLEEIIKNTEPNHPDLQTLQEALEEIKQVSTTVNDRMKENARREQVKAVEERFGGSIVLLAPARRYVMEGAMCKIERRDDREYLFFLFTDCLVYGSQPSFGTTLKYQNLLPIDAVFDVKEVTTQTDFDNIFQISSSVESFYVYTVEEEAKKTWMEAMTKLRNDYKELRVRLNQDLIAAPLFVPDDFSPVCMIPSCKAKFTFIERRHHCYYCGFLVCGKCSSQRLPEKIGASETKTNMVRVCDSCYEKHRGKFPELNGSSGNNAIEASASIEDDEEFTPLNQTEAFSLEPNRLLDMFIERERRISQMPDDQKSNSNGSGSASEKPTKTSGRVTPAPPKRVPSSNGSTGSPKRKSRDFPAELSPQTSGDGKKEGHERYASVKEFLEEDIFPTLSQMKNNNAQLRTKNDQLTTEINALRKDNEKLKAKVEQLLKNNKENNNSRNKNNETEQVKSLTEENKALRDENTRLQETIRMLKEGSKQNLSKGDQSKQKPDDLTKEIAALKSDNAKLQQQLAEYEEYKRERAESKGLSSPRDTELPTDLTEEEANQMKENSITVTDQQRQCAKCQLVIEGRAFKAANGALYHRKCFTCDMCKKLLLGKKYGMMKKPNGVTAQFCEECTLKHNEEEIKKIEQENKLEQPRPASKSSGGSSRSLVNQIKAAQSTNTPNTANASNASNASNTPNAPSGASTPDTGASGGRVCLQCKEKIVGRGIQTPTGELYHLACFSCDECKMQVAGKPYGLLPVGNTTKRLCGDCMDKYANALGKF